MIDLNLNPTRKELRLFAVLQVVFFYVVAAIVYRRTGSLSVAGWIVGISALVGVVGVLIPGWMRWVYVVWMLAVYPIGWVVSHLLLAGVFFLVLTPVGLIMTLCGRDPMQRRFDLSMKTYWQRRPPEEGTERYFRQF